MDPSIPLHKQLSNKIGIILLLFSSVIALLCYLLYSRELDVDKFMMHVQPELESYSELNRLAWQINVDYSQLIASTTAPDVLNFHRRIQANTLNIKQLPTNGKTELVQIDSQLEQLYLSVNGLAENNERNALLKRSALSQLRLALNEIELATAEKQPEADKLFQQIMADNVADRVTVSRAKAHVILSKELTLLKETHEAITNLLVIFEQLDLQTQLVEFNYETKQVERMLTQWVMHWDNSQKLTESDQKLLSVFSTLQDLLFDDQNTVAKWRGHIRVANDYFYDMQELAQNINQVISKIKAADIALQNLPGVLNEIPYTSGKNSREMYYISTLALVSIFFLLGCLLAHRIYLSLKRHAYDMKHITDSAVLHKTVDERALWNRELVDLANKITEIEQPEHGEAEYQALAKSAKQESQNLFELGHVAAFTVKSFTQLSGDNAQVLIFSGASEANKRWVKAFDSDARKEIIGCLRQAIKQSSPANCFVENRWSKQLQVFLSVNANTIHGTVIDQELMKSQIATIQEELNAVKSDQQMLLQEYANQLEEVNQAISRAMIQAQNPNKSFEDICLQSYRHQAKLLEWSEHALLLAQAKLSEPLHLSNTDLLQLLQVCSFKTVVKLRSQRLRVLFDIDDELKTNVKIAQPYFSYFIENLINIAVAEQLSATLVVRAEVIDIDPGQQKVQLLLQVKQKYNIGVLPELVQLLIAECNNKSPIMIKSLFRALQYIHGEIIAIEPEKEGYNVSVQLPLATSEQREISEIEHVDFTDKQIFLAGQKGQLISSLQSSVTHCKGKVETFFTADHLLKALHVKPIKALAADVVILAPDIFKSDQDRIVQQINSLPSVIRPKLFVLQSLFGKHTARQGIFSFPDSCFFNTEFCQELDKALRSDKSDNKLVDANAYCKQQYRQSNIQLLLVVARFTQHSSLITQLHSLGLKVHVESDAQSAQRLWQSGRYQLLMTDIVLNPYVEMQVGKPLYRGVFTLNKQLNFNDRPKSFAHWKIQAVPHIEQVDDFIELLSPWLIKLPQANEIAGASIKPHQSILSRDSSSEKQFAALELDPAHNVQQQPRAFDLQGFVKNQGSVELAALMLDEYLEQLHDIFFKVEKSDFKQSNELSQYLKELHTIAQILTATEFKQAIEKSQQAIKNGESLSIEQSLEALKEQLEILQAYSLAI